MNNQVSDEIKVQQWVSFLRYGLGVVLAVAVAGAIYLFVSHNSEKHAEAAFSALFQANKLEEAALKESGAGNKSTNAYALMKSWPDDKKKDYEQKLQVVVNQYGGSVAAAWASIKLGRWYFELGQFDKSVESYKTFSQKNFSGSEGSLFRAMALTGMGTSYESLNKWDDALKAYQEALNIPSNPLKPIAYLGAARCDVQKGDKAGAKSFYEKVQTEFPNTDYEKKAKALVALEKLAG